MCLRNGGVHRSHEKLLDRLQLTVRITSSRQIAVHDEIKHEINGSTPPFPRRRALSVPPRPLHCRSQAAWTSASLARILLSLRTPLSALHHSKPLKPLSLPSLCLLRNLCAGEISSQDSFIACRSADTVASEVMLSSEASAEVLRDGVQLLGNVVLAGEPHRAAVWGRLFPDGFLRLAGGRERGFCDPLCMCCSEIGGKKRLEELCDTDSGLRILVEIVRTALKGRSIFHISNWGKFNFKGQQTADTVTQ